MLAEMDTRREHRLITCEFAGLLREKLTSNGRQPPQLR